MFRTLTKTLRIPRSCRSLIISRQWGHCCRMQGSCTCRQATFVFVGVSVKNSRLCTRRDRQNVQQISHEHRNQNEYFHEWIKINKIRLRERRRSRWNRKEWNVFKKNMARDVQFFGNRITTSISLLTLTITKKHTLGKASSMV